MSARKLKPDLMHRFTSQDVFFNPLRFFPCKNFNCFISSVLDSNRFKSNIDMTFEIEIEGAAWNIFLTGLIFFVFLLQTQPKRNFFWKPGPQESDKSSYHEGRAIAKLVKRPENSHLDSYRKCNSINIISIYCGQW